jgi:hypothetical protein
MNKKQKVKYLNDVRDGKQPIREVNYSAMTDEELNRIISICEKLGISEASPENLIQVGATKEEQEFFEMITSKYYTT